MYIDMNAITNDMLEAMKIQVGKDWGKVQSSAKQILERSKKRLLLLGELRLTNKLTQEEFEDKLDDEKLMIEAALNALAVINKVLVQNAVNAALEVLVKAVQIAL